MNAFHILVNLLTLGLAAPELSQAVDHDQNGKEALKTKVHSQTSSTNGCTAEHAAMGHCKLADEKFVPTDGQSKPKIPDCSPDHAAMGHCTPKATATSSEAGSKLLGTDQPAGNAPAPEAPEVDYADKVWGQESMASARSAMFNEHGGMFASKFLLDLAVARNKDGEDGYQWESEAWLGEDLNRIILKSEGEGLRDEAVESSEVQVLYSRAVGPYFSLQAGVRHDFKPVPSRTHFTLGFEGLAPYWNEIEGTLFLSEKGRLLGRFKGHYDQLVTQSLVLETVAEINLSSQSIENEEIGSGIVDAEFSFRLRYEIEKEIAPYFGVSWKSKFSETARYAKASDREKEHSSFLAGLRLWL